VENGSYIYRLDGWKVLCSLIREIVLNMRTFVKTDAEDELSEMDFSCF
jgi:hypothetical protein